jgi:DNA-binding transcriptional regulator LsrR (DeoR family)
MLSLVTVTVSVPTFSSALPPVREATARQVMGFATGVDRVEAVRAAATSSSTFSSLVIDGDLANALMRMES